MKGVFFAVVVSMLAACGALEEEDGLRDLDLSTKESAVWQCSFGCAAGFHPVAFMCSSSCAGSGTCSTVYNRTDCQPNTGASFNSCSLGCPPGYTPVSFSYNPNCRTSGSAGTGNNQTFCVL